MNKTLAITLGCVGGVVVLVGSTFAICKKLKKNKQKKADVIVEEVKGIMTTDSEGKTVLVKDSDN